MNVRCKLCSVCIIIYSVTGFHHNVIAREGRDSAPLDRIWIETMNISTHPLSDGHLWSFLSLCLASSISKMISKEPWSSGTELVIVGLYLTANLA